MEMRVICSSVYRGIFRVASHAHAHHGHLWARARTHTHIYTKDPKCAHVSLTAQLDRCSAMLGSHCERGNKSLSHGEHAGSERRTKN